MNDETLQKLLDLLYEGVEREISGKEKFLKHLRDEARLQGFKGVSRLNKVQLEKLLSRPQDLGRLTKFQLLKEAKKLGINNVTKLKKTQLINEIDDKVLKLEKGKTVFLQGFHKSIHTSTKRQCDI